KLCDFFGARNIVSPRIALGVLQAELQRHDAARATFHELVTKHPSDPRGWAGLAGAQYYLNSYSDAVISYRECLNLLRRGDAERGSHERDMVHNLGWALVALERFEEALAEIENLPERFKMEPSLQKLREHIRFSKGV